VFNRNNAESKRIRAQVCTYCHHDKNKHFEVVIGQQLFGKLSLLANRLTSHPADNFSAFKVIEATVAGVRTPALAMPVFQHGSILDRIANYRTFEVLLWVCLLMPFLSQNNDSDRSTKLPKAWQLYTDTDSSIQTYIR
jgi:hypothetical protein